jgi:DNA helicase-2/ATP-dependent DNA helicase PcrA
MAMPAAENGSWILEGLNCEQRQAVQHGDRPLLIVAGAGTGKTKTLVHRVAHQIQQGIAPGRILLLTFTRRAAAEMLRRVDGLLRQLHGNGRQPGGGSHIQAVWGGTFHAIAARLLRLYAPAAGLEPAFTILDRGDSEDLLDVVRTELGLSKTDQRFPRKGTCLAIYSHCVNAQQPLEDVLAAQFPWCREQAADLKRLFAAYGERKEQGGILDYDDLLLFWRGLLADPQAGAAIRSRFDGVLVDEYQDTNRVQAEILQLLRPDGQGLTAVGDDAQSIYSFRAATVRNILDFPAEFPGATIVKLEQNYRSTQPLLAATNQVISQAQRRFRKDLWSSRDGGELPHLVTCQDESDQAEFLIREILRRREEGLDLRRQAVLYRTSHHSVLLEGELTRRNIPYVKFGGLKFLEAAHIKDLLAVLRLAENPRDLVAGVRLLQLLPGIGPKRARQLMELMLASRGDWRVWESAAVGNAAGAVWPQLLDVLRQLTRQPVMDLPSQVSLARRFYEPILQDKYDNPTPRKRDLEQIEQLAARFADRQSLLTQLALDPPESTEDFAGPPLLDEDYLILSTIHSAKGLEWDAVYVIHAADGNIPSDMATGNDEQIEEELRLFYVALTRAKNHLYVCHPQRYYHANRGGFTDRHSFAQLTRFIPPPLKAHFQTYLATPHDAHQSPGAPVAAALTSRQIRSQIQAMWS